MSWKQLLAEHKVHTHRTSKKEVDGLRELIARDAAGGPCLGTESHHYGRSIRNETAD